MIDLHLSEKVWVIIFMRAVWKIIFLKKDKFFTPLQYDITAPRVKK